MNLNMIKLTLDNGKGVLVQPGAIQIVESFTKEEKKKTAACGVWLMLDNVVSSAILQDQYEAVTRKLPSDRLQLTGKDGKKFSLSPYLIAHVIERDDDMTLVRTTLNSAAGPISLEVHESADAILAAVSPAEQEALEPDEIVEKP